MYTPMLYILNLTLEVKKAFYDLHTPKFPLDIESKVVYFKRSSRLIEKRLSHAGTNTVYAVQRHVDVNVDLDTRKPSPYPDWWRNLYNFPTEGEPQKLSFPEKMNQLSYTTQHKVQFSDTDENGHANFAAYIRFCNDSFSENALKARYNGEIDVYDVKLRNIDVTFHNECNIGDMLDVESWQDTNVLDQFYFQVKNGNDLVTSVRMKFFMDKDTNNTVSTDNSSQL